MSESEDNQKIPESESIRSAMEAAWRDHHHARNQTWKTIQIVAALGAGMVTIDVKYHLLWATLTSAALVIIAALTGIAITYGHRKLERRKFIHIMNCEEELGLHKDYLIPLDPCDGSLGNKNPMVKYGAVKVPELYRFRDIFNPFVNNTSIFIMRMHIMLIIFSLLLLLLRVTSS